jgi:hypothetical protein
MRWIQEHHDAELEGDTKKALDLEQIFWKEFYHKAQSVSWDADYYDYDHKKKKKRKRQRLVKRRRKGQKTTTACEAYDYYDLHEKLINKKKYKRKKFIY